MISSLYLRNCIRAALALMAIFMALFLLIRLLPNDQRRLEELRALITPPEGCPMPCWAGIRPGVTAADEALAILKVHPWVGEVTDRLVEEFFGDGLTLRGSVLWKWNGAQPNILKDTGFQNVLYVDGGIVYRIFMGTHMLVGDVWLLLGIPDNGGVFGDEADNMLRIWQVRYLDQGIMVDTVWRCPVDPFSVWSNPLALSYSSRLDMASARPIDGPPRSHCP